MRTRLIAADPAHIPHLAAHMREADREEVWAWSGSGPDDALRRSLQASTLAWAALLGDEPVCMFGVASETLLGRIGVPWLLGTQELDEYPTSFGRASRWGLAQMRAVFPVLANWSDARHERAHAWLEWLGFTLGEPQPMGPFGLPFRPFGMNCHV